MINATAKPLLFSLKPRYANLVFEGLKEAEFRKRISSCMENRDVFVYVTSPVRQLRGGFRVGHVWSGTPEEVWKRVSGLAGVCKSDFDAYYAGRTVAHALEIKDVWEYKNPANLNALGNRLPDFIVPQSWRYVRPEEYRLFRKMKRLRKKPEQAESLNAVG